MSGVIWVCDKCGKQYKSDDEKQEHGRMTEPQHNSFTPIPEDQNIDVEFRPIVDGHKTVLATTVDITDMVLDQIADRVVEKLIKRIIKKPKGLLELTNDDFTMF